MIFLQYLINPMIIYSFHNEDCATSHTVNTDKTCWPAPDGECAVLLEAHTPLVPQQLGDPAGGPIDRIN